MSLTASAIAMAVAAGSISSFARGAEGAADEVVDFVRDVRPLLEARCTRCHGATKPKAGLRLDRRAGALAVGSGDTEPVIVAGDVEASELWRRISSADADERMPPEGEPLDAGQLELFRRWIAAGAEWPDVETARATLALHWAYVAPVRPTPPSDPFALAQGVEAARNEVDLFVRARQAELGLCPGPRADARTLIRRLWLDLCGLPPEPAEIEAFLSDEARDPDGAWERALDRALASPHYAEERARHWLDLARYADTNGYEKDDRRELWRWRDWILAAFADDMPYDQFTLRQLAGDLLPSATLEDRVATGFHRNTMTNLEGGVDPEEFRVAAVIDRVNTTSAVWLGSTLGCAQCHDHKFDPFAQREYYALLAFFNQTADDGRSNEPVIEAPTAAEIAHRREIEPEIAQLEARLAGWDEELEADLAKTALRWRETAVTWTRLAPSRATARRGSTLELRDDGSVLASGDLPSTETYEVALPAPADGFAALRVDVLLDPSLPEGGPGRPSHGNFVLSRLEVELATPDGAREKLALAGARADFEQRTDRHWSAAETLDGDPTTGWAIARGEGRPHQLVVALAQERGEIAPGSELHVTLHQDYGGGHLIGRFAIAVARESTDRLFDEGLPLFGPDLEELLAEHLAELGAPREDSNALSPHELERLRALWRQRAPLLDPVRERLATLRAELLGAHTLVLQERAEPRPTYVLAGGNFLSPTEPVEPDVPHVLNPWPAGAPRNRLGLAQWLVDRANPLTARVCVNRLWSELFGRGLVATPSDFGTQGDPPTFPALLDWLAAELVESGWSQADLVRLVASSATYRQASDVTEARLALDPDARWLTRYARRRVDAEVVRDVALAAAGVLDRTVGGPSVFPWQPAGIWASTYSGDRWPMQDPEAASRRRGLYTFWKRTAPYPAFATFDAPSRELVCTHRARTNTPLQALALLNDPDRWAIAGELSARLLAQPAATVAERAALGFELCTGRPPESHELDVLSAFATDRLALSDEARAWQLVANVLLSLDETLTIP